MTGFRQQALVLGLLCLAGAGWSVLRAGEESAVTPSLADLLTRISQLEKRIAVLEDRETVTRQVNAEDVPGNPPRMTDTPKSVEPAAPPRPQPRIWLLRQAERK